MGETETIPEEILTRNRELGLFGLSIPGEYGGAGAGTVGRCAIYEETGKISNTFTTVIEGHTGMGSLGIVALGNEEQKRRYLAPMSRGELIGAFALTEPQPGTDVSNVETRTARKGDKNVVNGQKRHIINGTVIGIGDRHGCHRLRGGAARDHGLHGGRPLPRLPGQQSGPHYGPGTGRTGASSSSRTARYTFPTCWARRAEDTPTPCACSPTAVSDSPPATSAGA